MRNIETEIQALKAEIAMLEEQQRSGYVAEDKDYDEYYISDWHTCVRGTDGMFAGIIVDEAAVRKYLADKDAA